MAAAVASVAIPAVVKRDNVTYFRVETRCARDDTDGDDNTLATLHRFNDFKQLHATLAATGLAPHILKQHPMPPAVWFVSDTTVEQRRICFENMLRAFTAPGCGFDTLPVVRLFLGVQTAGGSPDVKPSAAPAPATRAAADPAVPELDTSRTTPPPASGALADARSRRGVPPRPPATDPPAVTGATLVDVSAPSPHSRSPAAATTPPSSRRRPRSRRGSSGGDGAPSTPPPHSGPPSGSPAHRAAPPPVPAARCSRCKDTVARLKQLEEAAALTRRRPSSSTKATAALARRHEAELVALAAAREAEVARLQSEAQTARAEADNMHMMVEQLREARCTARVFCRVRPLRVPGVPQVSPTGERAVLATSFPDGRTPSGCERVRVCTSAADQTFKMYSFDRVFAPDTSQFELYAAVEPLVVAVMDGYNAAIVSYGQTGSGKTYTMDGPDDSGVDPAARGINSRAMAQLFRLAAARTRETGHTFTVECSASEVYREKVYDLLQLSSRASTPMRRDSDPTLPSPPLPPGAGGGAGGAGGAGTGSASAVSAVCSPLGAGGGTSGGPSPAVVQPRWDVRRKLDADVGARFSAGAGARAGDALSVATDSGGSVVTRGLSWHAVSSADDVARLMAQAKTHRATARHALNWQSSRSHLIVVVRVECTAPAAGSGRGASGVSPADAATAGSGGSGGFVSRLTLVDLAGSERVAQSEAAGTTLKEAAAINSSLASLGNVMEALARKAAHVPFRSCKLTRLLEPCLTQCSRLLVIVCCSSSSLDVRETVSSLKFATRGKELALRVQPQAQERELLRLRVEVRRLRQQLAAALGGDNRSDGDGSGGGGFAGGSEAAVTPPDGSSEDDEGEEDDRFYSVLI